MKSLLLVPGNSLDRYEKALDSGADALIVDLSAAPLDLNRGRTGASRSRLVARVGSRPGSIDADLDLAMPAAPDAVMMTGVVGGAGIQHLATKLAVREAEWGIPDGTIGIVAIVADTARGILGLGSVPSASRRLGGLGWRTESSADANSLSAPDGLARSLTLVAAAASEVDAIDAAFPDHDLDALARHCETARRDGFSAKLAIAATQIRIIGAA